MKNMKNIKTNNNRDIVLCRKSPDKSIISSYHGFFLDGEKKYDIRTLSEKEISDFLEDGYPYFIPMLIDRDAKISFNDKFVILYDGSIEEDIHILDDENYIEYYNNMENAFLALSCEEKSDILDEYISINYE